MATQDLESSDIKKQMEIEDITRCCICTDVYTDPKALPCIHTFCRKCLQETGLKANKGPGDKMPCPICRQYFKIPPEGLCGLPKNFFIERLIQVANISDSSAATKALCTLCLEESKEQEGKESSTADAYCVDCKYKLCDECCKEHRKFKLTKNHKLILIDEYESGQTVLADLAPVVCSVHEQRDLDVYCADCKTVACAMCFVEKHNSHKGFDVNKRVDDFRKQIQNNTEALIECVSQARMKKAEIMKAKEEMLKLAESMECGIGKRNDEIKRSADKHANCLLQSVCSETQNRLKEIQIAANDIDIYVSKIESYNSYCQEIIVKGSASDICGAQSDLSVRAIELQQQFQPIIQRVIQEFKLNFRPSELEELLDEDRFNLIGEIEKEGDLKPKRRSKHAMLTEQSEEIEILRNKIEELREEGANYNAQTEKLKQELMTYKEKLRKVKVELRYRTDPVLVHTIIAPSSKVGKRCIAGLAVLDKELFVVSESSSKVEVYDMRFRLTRQWNLDGVVYPQDMASCNTNNCLYIVHSLDSFQFMDILRLDSNGKLIQMWTTAGSNGRLSVTSESNVLLTVCNKDKLNEYSPGGQLLREINADIRWPWHAIKLTNGHFVVSHGNINTDLNRVCIVDADGKLRESFEGKHGLTIGLMNEPYYMSVDAIGFVMVIDRWNRRVLLLDSDLEFKGNIFSKEDKYGLQDPRRILLDESNARVFVADNDSNDGRILIFDVTIR